MMKKSITVAASVLLAAGMLIGSASAASAAGGAVNGFSTITKCNAERKLFIQDGYGVSTCNWTGAQTKYGFQWWS